MQTEKQSTEMLKVQQLLQIPQFYEEMPAAKHQQTIYFTL